MQCPVCKEPMIILEYEQVEVDYCIDCGGIWLDAGELELLFGDDGECEKFMKAGGSVGATKEKPRRCPICGKKMGKSVTGGEEPVTYDDCPKGHGFWFDKGELQEILKHGFSGAGGGEVSGFLREVFPETPKE
ncbi:zf-TFIIB domain-containing protein [Candidatus Hydrogenedentota bacterium]